MGDAPRGDRQQAAARVSDAVVLLHYAAHVLGDGDEARRLRWFADTLHALLEHLKRG